MISRSSSIQVKMLGDFAILHEGEPLRLERNNTTKGLKALQLLLYRWPASVSRDTLLNALYADEQVSDPINNLKVTISNLRKLLQQTPPCENVNIRYKGGSYYFESDKPFSIDVHNFSALVKESASVHNASERLNLLLRAFDMYEGSFLPHLSKEPWASVSAAEHREELFVCMRLIYEILSNRDEWERLLPLVTKTCMMYNIEEWQCLRIDCLMKLERYAEAKQVYEDAVTNLDENFFGKPSPELANRFHLLKLTQQESYETIFQLTHQLKEPEQSGGAFYCSYPSFVDIFRMNYRVSERNSQSSFLLLYWLTDTKGQLLEDGTKISAAARKLNEAICSSLRRSDVFTQHGRDRFLVLLSVTDRKSCHLVHKRIVATYKKNSVWGVSIKHTLQATAEPGLVLPRQVL